MRRLAPEIWPQTRVALRLRKLVQRDGEHDDDAEEDRLNARVDAQQVHRIGQNEKEDGAECDHLDPADAAFDADPGNHRRGDTFERQLRIDHRLARSELCGECQIPIPKRSTEQIT